jgi:carboxyl-terminal processing protease
LETNTHFKTIQSLNHLFLTEYLFINKTYALTLKNVYDDISNSKNLWNQLSDKLKKAQLSIVTKNSASTEEIISYNEEDAEINNTNLKDIANDIYIEEAYNILTDYINLSKNH